jgi:hypothetical protein
LRQRGLRETQRTSAFSQQGETNQQGNIK